jgi:DNA helicase-2/ATP-dependent DNA helicase PcrA
MARTYVLKSTAPQSRLGIPYDKDLNDEQRDVVFSPDGPILVIAGAGSGKTRALTYRVAYLLDRGVAPQRILLLTFTNRAARQMLERVEQLCGAQSRALLGGTFHHVANLLLKERAEAVGYRPNFTILDREDAREVLAAATAEVGLDIKARRFPKADVVLELISSSLNEQKMLSDIIARDAPHFLAVQQEIVTVARQYVMRKVAQNVMDFDDLLMNLKVLLAEDHEISRQLRSRFEHVLVDEYQDTNQLQGDIVDLMASHHHNVLAVGDDAQSIYSFRGARFENILGFPDRHPGTRIRKLEVNYRSTPQILRLANESSKRNTQRYDKTLRSVRPHGPSPALVAARDVFDQATFVAQRVLELRDEGVSLKDVAVLYRAHSHAMELQIELTRRGIPYVVRSGLRFFEQAHVKDAVSYLRWIHNPLEELALRRTVKLHDGVGNAAAQTIWEHVADALRAGKDVQNKAFLNKIPLSSSPRAKTGMAQYADLVEELMRPSVRNSPQEMIRAVLEGGYRDYLRKHFPNSKEREVDLEQLSDYCAAFGTLEEMLNEISLMESVGGETVMSAEDPDEKLTLSSIHQGKGLEWSRVFVIWAADGRIPSDMALKDLHGEEEERRVFYVACTRAKDELYLVYPTMHQGRDRSMTIQRPSRFLTELGDTSRDDGPDSMWERWNIASETPPLMGGPVLPLLDEKP